MRIKQIVLIEPKAPASHVYSMVKMPRLGLPLLATHLKETGYAVSLIYGTGDEIKVSNISRADLVGISTTTSTCKEAYSIARYARSKGIPVVLGGVHATFMPEEALQYADFVCRGEADNTFSELLDCLQKGKAPLDVPGVSFRRGSEIVHNPLPDWVNVENTPIPQLSLITNLEKIGTYPVMTSRGCPYNCTFCSVTLMFGRRYRCRDDENVLAELAQYKGENVFFCDDNFTANPRRTKTLLKKMIERKILPKWWGAQVRTDAARDEELLSLMRRAKCGTVYIGMESINPQTLKAYNKRQDVADIEYCINKFHKYNIMVHGMFVFGGDDDTVQTIRETADFALDTGIDTVQFLILTPLPGTPVFKKMEKEGRLLTRNWSFYDGHHVVFRPKQMSPQELQAETIKAFKKFYSLKNVARNLPITGWSSLIFRCTGNYLVKRWEKQSGWYRDFLETLLEPGKVKAAPLTAMHNAVQSLKIGRFKYLPAGKLVDIHISKENDSIIIELQGYLNNFTLKQVFRTVKEVLPRYQRYLTINAADLGFASEEVAKKFVQVLNVLAERAYSVKVKLPDNNFFMSLLERYDLSIPNFEC